MKRRLFLFAMIVLIVGVHLWLLTRLRYEMWPEMLLIPYLLHNGFRLYSDMVYHYNPGLAWIGQAWVGVFGVAPEAIKILTWTFILINDCLIWVIASRRWGNTAGIVALLSMVLLQPLFDGNELWYELAMTPWLLLAFWTQQPFFIALSFLVKQSTFWFFPVLFQKWKQTGLFIVIAFLTLSLVFWRQGSLREFWFWPYRFIFTIFPSSLGYKDLATWRHWVLPLGMTTLVVGQKFFRERSLKFLRDPRDPALWALLGLPLLFPRFGLFHFQVSVAFLSLAIGQNLTKEADASESFILRYVPPFGLLLIAAAFWYRMVTLQWGTIDRFLEPGVYQAAARVAFETSSEKPVFLLNGPEQIYVLAKRLPPKPWLTQFSWFLDVPGFQEQLVTAYRKQGLSQVFITPYQYEGEYVQGSYQPKLLREYIEGLGAKELLMP